MRAWGVVFGQSGEYMWRFWQSILKSYAIIVTPICENGCRNSGKMSTLGTVGKRRTSAFGKARVSPALA